MFRLKLALIAAGGFLCFFGYEEFVVSQKASTPAAEVELKNLETSTELSNNFVRVLPHWAIYSGSIYEYQMGKYETGDPDNNTKVNYAYYPVISDTHPYFVKVSALFERYGEAKNIPDNAWPELEKFSVLVKTKRFKTIGSIPNDWMESDALEGLVINRIESLDSEEKELLRENFPQMNFEEILILEEGRLPSSKMKSLGMMGGGGLLALAGLALLFKRRSQSV